MLPRAVTERVAYVPGTAFYADGQGRGHMRLSYCYPTPERIREGVRRLAAVIDAELEVLETFGPQPGAGQTQARGRPPGPGRLPRSRPHLTRPHLTPTSPDQARCSPTPTSHVRQ